VTSSSKGTHEVFSNWNNGGLAMPTISILAGISMPAPSESSSTSDSRYVLDTNPNCMNDVEGEGSRPVSVYIGNPMVTFCFILMVVILLLHGVNVGMLL